MLITYLASFTTKRNLDAWRFQEGKEPDWKKVFNPLTFDQIVQQFEDDQKVRNVTMSRLRLADKPQN